MFIISKHQSFGGPAKEGRMLGYNMYGRTSSRTFSHEEDLERYRPFLTSRHYRLIPRDAGDTSQG